MWTTSNSRAEWPWRRAAALALVTAISLAACQARTAPEAPRAHVPSVAEVPPAVGQSALTRQVALSALSVRRFDPSDVDLAQTLGGVMPRDRRNAIVIEVTTTDPLDARPRAGLPVIELNGRTLPDTRIRPDGHRLVAVVPERAIDTERNLVAVVWLGSETATRTREPLGFGPEDIRE